MNQRYSQAQSTRFINRVVCVELNLFIALVRLMANVKRNVACGLHELDYRYSSFSNYLPQI
ncbi:hypothetical protein KC19_VG278400 [Ceratodon purpureus]|uniref:Uncharacterized protein n=1 Tax=Ceratodon purpureus TaxID=3225 RepID=A0A8T0HUI2_CERPU|nr:hypothetical protein KC19_VG278400 [Ceratodon purpureus]